MNIELTGTITIMEAIHAVIALLGLLISTRAITDAIADSYAQSLADPRNDREREVHRSRMAVAGAEERSAKAMFTALLCLAVIALMLLTLPSEPSVPDSPAQWVIGTARLGAILILTTSIEHARRGRRRALNRELTAARAYRDQREREREKDVPHAPQ